MSLSGNGDVPMMPQRLLHYVLLIALSPMVSMGIAEGPVEIGTPIKPFTFKDIRYLPRTLTDLGDHAAYVFVFTNTTCPLVQRYLPRLIRLHEQYGPQDVQFVAMNVGYDDTLRDVAAHALHCHALFPFVKDTTGEVTRVLGASRTPEVVVLDRLHRLVYRGRIDDQYRLGGALPQPRRHDLEEALRDLLAGRPVTVAQTPVDGCQITFPEIEPDRALTYTQQVAPILQKHCCPCHREGTAAPFSLVDYQEVVSQANMIAEVVHEERMPPWFANPQHGTFQNNRSLTQQQRTIIQQWVHSGMARGNFDSQLADADTTTSSQQANRAQQVSGPEQTPSKWHIDRPDLILTMNETHELPADGFIPYRYVMLPHVFLSTTWIEAFEIMPDNRKVVHHANLFYAGVGQKPGSSSFITGYVPGGQPMDLTHFDTDVAYSIPPLTMLGLQIHYTTTGQPEHARISVGLRFKRGKVQKKLHHNLADPHDFAIPARHPAYPVRDSFTLAHDASLLGLFAHMHLRGKDMTFLAHHPNGTTETLLELPNYNFDWQLGYEIAAGDKRLPKGTRIEAVAHYDNSAFNPYNPDPDKVIRYGPQTIDEMMNGYVFFTYDDESLNLSIDPKTGHQQP